jgi:signal peptidase II
VACGALLIAADQLTKYLLTLYLPVNSGKVVIPGFFNLVHVRNTGGAFSMFAAGHSTPRLAVFIILTVIVLAVLVYAYNKTGKNDRWTRAAYILIAGGAAGNLIDRIRMGEVIDFLDFYAGSYHWPAFNVADSAITVGAGLLLLSLIRGE